MTVFGMSVNKSLAPQIHRKKEKCLSLRLISLDVTVATTCVHIYYPVADVLFAIYSVHFRTPCYTF